jgi:hypothetical protein
MKFFTKSKFLRILALFVSIFTSSLFVAPMSASAQVVEVEGQSDCSHLGTDWRSAGLVVVVGAGRTYTLCAKMEQVVVTPTPSSNSTTSGPEPETVSRVAGADPYPNIPTGGEIPGTRIVSTDETSWAQFASSTASAQWRCPLILGPNGDPYAAESNGFDSASGKWFRVCVKNPWREPIPKSITSAYEAEKSAAIAEAAKKSQAWNEANPGKQRCFQWGPLTSPNGGTESGGVCANPFGVSSGASETLTRTEQVSRVASISNTNKRTAAALKFLKSLDSADRAELLEVSQTANRRTVLEIDLGVPRIPFIVKATRDRLPTITFRGTTDADGEFTIRTKKSLGGYALTLSVRKVKLDLDVFG